MLINFVKKLIWQKLTAPIRQFFKFCLVGFSGSVINIVILWLLVDQIHWHYLLATTVSFLLSVVNNYFWNKYWTFKEQGRLSTVQFLNFLLISVVGLAINLLAMYLLINNLHIYYLIAQFIAILIVTFWNFLMNKKITFKQSI